MRRAIKKQDSTIVIKNLTYSTNNSTQNKRICDILLLEQKKFCAYTDEPIGRTDEKDIEHFNPTLKNTSADNYQNWFLVKHQWNKEKSKKWEKFQPIMHPTANDFETRIIYITGDYICSPEDIEAKNLLSLLNISDACLANERKRYIKRKKERIEESGKTAHDYFNDLIQKDSSSIKYLRAINEEFEIDIWNLLQ